MGQPNSCRLEQSLWNLLMEVRLAIEAYRKKKEETIEDDAEEVDHENTATKRVRAA